MAQTGCIHGLYEFSSEDYPVHLPVRVFNSYPFVFPLSIEPSTLTGRFYSEAVEAPLMAKHQLGIRQITTSHMSPDLNAPLPPLPNQNDVIIDGTLHPALRSTPDLVSQDCMNRSTVSVPNPHWTYSHGRSLC